MGVVGATIMGLGSILGTGVFVSIGVAAGEAGPSVVLAIALAAAVAACNALSSAQLAASHPVSGGTYEYGYRYLSPAFGFTAGWMFLCAKTASAATALLGFAGYLLQLLHAAPQWQSPLAVSAAIILTLLVASGLKRSSQANVAIVLVTGASLLAFIAFGLPDLGDRGAGNFSPFFPQGVSVGSFLYATALMFVAFAGYARIATLSEEVSEPRRTIPRAIIITLCITAVLYMVVAVVAVGAVGAPGLSQAAETTATPLEAAGRALSAAWVGDFIAVGAIAAMLGVALNLVLGLSRVVLAMGRTGDLPSIFGRLDGRRATPLTAVIGVGLAIGILAMVGSVKTTWSFSAFSVLVYYAITNLAALRLPRGQRLFHPSVAIAGLAACLVLAFFVPPDIWLWGLALIAGGLGWRALSRRVWRRFKTRE